MNPEMEQISKIITEIRTELQLCGLSPEQIAFKTSRLEKADADTLKQGRIWLIGFKAGFLPLYQKAYNLVPEGVWKAYAMTGVKGTYEQRELATAKRLIREEWSNRPEVLKKHGSSKRNTKASHRGRVKNSGTPKRPN